MKNKLLGVYVAIWLVVIAMFNVIAFAVPFEAKYSGMWWFGYVFITVALLAQILVYVLCYGKGKISDERTFLNISVVRSNFGFLIAAGIVGIVCMAVPGIPKWIGAVLCALISGFAIISTLLAKTAVDIVTKVGEEVKVKTFFIKSLAVDAQVLISEAKNADTKKLAEAVYDAIRFSDPMSSDELAEANDLVMQAFDKFATAVRSDDTEESSKYATEVLNVVKARNAKCKLLK